MTGVCSDITERKQFEEALQRSEEKFRNLIESSSDWIWEVDAAGTYTYSSPQVEAILGYKPQGIVGRTPFELMPEDEADRVVSIFNNVTKKGKAIIGLENSCLHRDGRIIVLETNGAPVFDQDGNIRYYRGIDRDITKRKKGEEKQEKLFNELQQALKDVKILSGLIPICANCKKIRDDRGYWNHLEGYIEKHSDVLFSHSICSDCSDELYGNAAWYQRMKNNSE